MPARRRRETLTEAARWLRSQSILDVGHLVRLDLEREGRTGVPEVVIAEGKRPEAVRAAVQGFLQSRGRAIVTRCPPKLRLTGLGGRVERHPSCGVVVVRNAPRPRATGGKVAILTGGA
ncbi:MAG: hypothetical protein HYT80_10560, partial [Euryarchaeota archaeon]|nr:hypothetical protein [Euryarchaeota archaeon]